MKPSPGIANAALKQVLELSAEAHVERRKTVMNSPPFHRLTGAIAAYGKAIGLLVALEERERFFAMIEGLDADEFVEGLIH